MDLALQTSSQPALLYTYAQHAYDVVYTISEAKACKIILKQKKKHKFIKNKEKIICEKI